jgi:hypothetical protein
MNGLLRGITNGTLIMLPFLACMVSCTVKEDRSVCPCILEVYFTGRDLTKDPVILAGWNDYRVFDETIRMSDCPEVYKRKVPRSMLSFGAVSGLVSSVIDGHTVRIPVGCECDSLYGYCDHVDCMGEKARTTVEFHKQFATVNLGILHSDLSDEDCTFLVSSGSCGIDMLACRALEGEFWFEPALIEGNRMHFRLPRQYDGSLSLTVRDRVGNDVVFPLGRYILAIGYDWNATDLQDIYLTLDINRGKVSVGIADWEMAEEFELTKVEM